MTSRRSEAAFETVIEAHLLQNGYVSVSRDGFDRERAIFPESVLGFIGAGPRGSEQMDTNGSLVTLRHGFKCYGRTLRVAFFKAALIAAAVTGRVNVNGSEVGV